RANFWVCVLFALDALGVQADDVDITDRGIAVVKAVDADGTILDRIAEDLYGVVPEDPLSDHDARETRVTQQEVDRIRRRVERRKREGAQAIVELQLAGSEERFETRSGLEPFDKSWIKL
ncbi:MAG: hypothetical protein R3284_09820, partial [Rubricoccaceae bacterium]|nr:hypothetical protein [Rubricoccaceae bacterium]